MQRVPQEHHHHDHHPDSLSTIYVPLNNSVLWFCSFTNPKELYYANCLFATGNPRLIILGKVYHKEFVSKVPHKFREKSDKKECEC